MNILLFGGSFNPIHLGHLSMAKLAQESFAIDKVFFIPTKNHPFHKDSLKTSEQARVEMVDLAIKDCDDFFLSKFELERDTTSYTYDTVVHFRELYPNSNIFLLIGEDNLYTFDKWYRYKELLEVVTLVVATRQGESKEVPPFLIDKIHYFPSPNWGLSSTEVRSYIKNGHSCQYLIHEDVVNYIKQNRLYIGETT